MPVRELPEMSKVETVGCIQCHFFSLNVKHTLVQDPDCDVPLSQPVWN